MIHGCSFLWSSFVFCGMRQSCGWLLVWNHQSARIIESYATVWCLGTCFFSPCIGIHHPNWLSFFQRGTYTTNQIDFDLWLIFYIWIRWGVSTLAQRYEWRVENIWAPIYFSSVCLYVSLGKTWIISLLKGEEIRDLRHEYGWNAIRQPWLDFFPRMLAHGWALAVSLP